MKKEIKKIDFMYDGAGKSYSLGDTIYELNTQNSLKIGSIEEFGNQAEEWYFEIKSETGYLLKRVYGNEHVSISFV